MDQDKIDKLAATLRDGLKHPPKMPLRRHHDDSYWDFITIETRSGGAHLMAFIRPRYKTSGLSGDEWRISAHLEVRRRRSDPEPIVKRGFHRMTDLLHYAPYFVFEGAHELLDVPSAQLQVWRKGHVLMTEERQTFGDAAMGMLWHIVTANEGRKGVDWHHLTDAEELTHCQQVGCHAPPTSFYQLKKLQVSPGASLMVEPKYDFEGQFVWYCPRHTTRGDCGMEDADENMVLVSGTGEASQLDEDESPARQVVLRGDVGEG